LICDSDGGNLAYSDACGGNHFLCDADLARPQIGWIMLDPTRLRIDLPKFALRLAGDFSGAIK
jgi:hypothetical protein